jgi:hypothetical protein
VDAYLGGMRRRAAQGAPVAPSQGQ